MALPGKKINMRNIILEITGKASAKAKSTKDLVGAYALAKEQVARNALEIAGIPQKHRHILMQLMRGPIAQRRVSSSYAQFINKHGDPQKIFDLLNAVHSLGRMTIDRGITKKDYVPNAAAIILSKLWLVPIIKKQLSTRKISKSNTDWTLRIVKAAHGLNPKSLNRRDRTEYGNLLKEKNWKGLENFLARQGIKVE